MKALNILMGRGFDEISSWTLSDKLSLNNFTKSL